jgi:hypothetical protein
MAMLKITLPEQMTFTPLANCYARLQNPFRRSSSQGERTVDSNFDRTEALRFCKQTKGLAYLIGKRADAV